MISFIVSIIAEVVNWSSKQSATAANPLLLVDGSGTVENISSFFSSWSICGVIRDILFLLDWNSRGSSELLLDSTNSTLYVSEIYDSRFK